MSVVSAATVNIFLTGDAFDKFAVVGEDENFVIFAADERFVDTDFGRDVVAEFAVVEDSGTADEDFFYGDRQQVAHDAFADHDMIAQFAAG